MVTTASDEPLFTTDEQGTPEPLWAAWKRTFPTLDFADCRRIVVVAPHPDDEILGVGGLMAVAAASGIAVSVVAVTDGGASHPGSPTMTPADLTEERSLESVRALGCLGLDVNPVRLGFDDGDVVAHEDELVRVLNELLPAEPGTWCLMPWRGDGHPDHEATGRACVAATEQLGITAVEYPVWMWHWATPDDERVPWDRAVGVDLPPHIADAKRRAAQQFVTQIEPLSSDPADRPVLPPHVLDRLLRSFEVVFV